MKTNELPSWLALMDWSDGSKAQVRYADESFVEMEGLTWKPPRYKQPDTLPWIPLEEEIDQLISACSMKVSVFLQGLKETEPRSTGRESKRVAGKIGG